MLACCSSLTLRYNKEQQVNEFCMDVGDLEFVYSISRYESIRVK